MFESLSNSTGCLKACKIQYSCIIGFVFYTSLLQYRKTPAVKAGSIKVEENVLWCPLFNNSMQTFLIMSLKRFFFFFKSLFHEESRGKKSLPLGTDSETQHEKLQEPHTKPACNSACETHLVLQPVCSAHSRQRQDFWADWQLLCKQPGVRNRSICTRLLFAHGIRVCVLAPDTGQGVACWNSETLHLKSPELMPRVLQASPHLVKHF